MIRQDINLNECWLDYDDLGGFQPGSTQFGAPADLAFQITGEVVPAPGALALLGLAGLAGRRRR
jgi:MYXO-CTERM domain-containing protein